MSTSKLLAGGGVRVADGSVTLVSDAGTLNKAAGRVTTEALTTAAEAAEAFTITNDQVTANSIILASISEYDGAGGPVISSVQPGAGSFVVNLINSSAATALDDSLSFDFVVLGQFV